jgi:beta-lactamase class D
MKSLLGTLALWLLVQSNALAWEDSAAISQLFHEQNIAGTFVLYDVQTQRLVGHAQERGEKRYVPASTFKIPHTLIGLTVGVVADVDQVLPYGGGKQAFASWERDMPLREAITLSNVPVYQGMARRIGLQRMSDTLALLDYGNGNIGTIVDRFWLDGPLEISAVEQARFLARLAADELPVPPEHQRSTCEILLLEQGEGWKLYGKTGWQNAPEPGIGWWVGWVEKEGQIYSFALNIDMRSAEDAATRLELGRASLRALGIL